MLYNSLVSNFTATPDVNGLVINLQWDITEQIDPLDLEIGEEAPELFPDFTGNILLVKHSHGYITNPYDTRAIVLFNGAVPLTADTYYFVDNGGNSADYTDYAPVNDLADWTKLGTGLAGGITYYYSIFLENSNGQYTYAPEAIFRKSYAYSRWGHPLWLKRRLPAHYWKYDDGSLAGMVSVMGSLFDSIKTDIDRLEYLNDPYKIDEDLIPLLADSLDWCDDQNEDMTIRRQELVLAGSYGKKKGRIDNYLDAIEFSTGYRPTIIEDIFYRWTTGSKGIQFIPELITAEEYDFGTLEGWINFDGGRYLGELGVQTVSVIYFPASELDGGWPPFQGFFNGHKIRTATEEAVIVSYNPTTRKIILDKLLDLSEYSEEAISLITVTCPRYSPFVNQDYELDLLRGTVAKKFVPGQNRNLSSIKVFIMADLLGNSAPLAKMARKALLYKDKLLSGGREISCYIQTPTFVEE